MADSQKEDSFLVDGPQGHVANVVGYPGFGRNFPYCVLKLNGKLLERKFRCGERLWDEVRHVLATVFLVTVTLLDPMVFGRFGRTTSPAVNVVFG